MLAGLPGPDSTSPSKGDLSGGNFLCDLLLHVAGRTQKVKIGAGASSYLNIPSRSKNPTKARRVNRWFHAVGTDDSQHSEIKYFPNGAAYFDCEESGGALSVARWVLEQLGFAATQVEALEAGALEQSFFWHHNMAALATSKPHYAAAFGHHLEAIAFQCNTGMRSGHSSRS
jgi:hypothetical protein